MMDREDRTVLTSQDVTEMVLRLAHEIRNPLATIKSSIQLVRRLEMSAQDSAPHFETALRHIERIHSTLREIERFVSLEEGDTGEVRVDAAVSGAVDLVTDYAREHDVRLDIEGGPEVSVIMDRRHLQIVLGELLENALDASEPGGSIALSWEREAPMILLHVDDEGSGVAADHAANILRPFFSTQTHGIGLGLNVVKRICDISGGNLEWLPRTGKGCRFTVTLKEA